MFGRSAARADYLITAALLAEAAFLWALRRYERTHKF